MKKYLSILKISFSQEMTYRLNFIMWRLRNVMQFLIVFFLWSNVFLDSSRVVFGYDKAKILTYIFGILIVKAFVFSSKTNEVAGEIARGDLTNYLVKPIDYFKYWFGRDLASKALNLSFALGEIIFLFLIFKPPIVIQTTPLFLLGFVVSIVVAIILYFFIVLIVNMIAFWLPEGGWAAQFLFLGIVTEFFSGAIFPLDILPEIFQKILYVLPFPYLLFFPLQVYLGKLTFLSLLLGISIGLTWIFLFVGIANFVWNQGLKRYEGEGR